MKKIIGLIGWRGMVGSVLIQRMKEEGDFNLIEPIFFSTSNIGKNSLSCSIFKNLEDAYNFELLKKLPIILTTYGSKYTDQVYYKLRSLGWNGIWIDAASSLRMKEDSLIILDPINRSNIDYSLRNNVKNYIGSNCTVSCILLGLSGLINLNLIEWINCSTYQAASGGGSNYMKELLIQFGQINNHIKNLLDKKFENILNIDRNVLNKQQDGSLFENNSDLKLAGNFIPWIDKDLETGFSNEETKIENEINKILGLNNNNIESSYSYKNKIKIESTCVRVGSLRCHGHSLLIKLKKNNLNIQYIENLISHGNNYVKFVTNNKKETLDQLTPVKVTGTLNISVGRLRKSKIGERYLSMFIVGDQLLWGAAEPLRRMLKIILQDS